MAASVHNHSHCCAKPRAPISISEKIFHLLEKVSAVAVGVFAAFASIELFLPLFLTGTAVGIYQSLTAEHVHNETRKVSSCSQGFLEQLTGVKLPPLLSLGANLAVTWCHIDHHTTVFVPVVGLTLGAWAGKSFADLSF